MTSCPGQPWHINPNHYLPIHKSPALTLTALRTGSGCTAKLADVALRITHAAVVKVNQREPTTTRPALLD